MANRKSILALVGFELTFYFAIGLAEANFRKERRTTE